MAFVSDAIALHLLIGSVVIEQMLGILKKVTFSGLLELLLV